MRFCALGCTPLLTGAKGLFWVHEGKHQWALCCMVILSNKDTHSLSSLQSRQVLIIIHVLFISSKQNSSVQQLSKIGSVTEWSQEELEDEIEKVLSSRVEGVPQ